MKLSLIVPAYNEEKIIKSTLTEYIKYFNSKDINYEIVAVIEGTDRTGEIVKSLAKQNKHIKYTISKKRLGKGGAIIKGFEISNGDVVSFVDADMATKPEAFDELLKQDKSYDVIIASRNMPGAIITKNRSALQRFGSWGFNTLVKIILGLNVSDTQCGAKVFNKKVIQKILDTDLTKNDWAFDAEILYIAKRNGFSIKEVPTIWEHRAEGAKFNFNKNFYKVVPRMFISLLKIRFLH